ncbi:hypothetical protein KRX54_02875 [Actinomycetaceae bacterium TAE3-ERU4]|nr:hypothetical protein [Actinomycetaceae bacterium TAE3-ERU4]
MTTNQPPSGNFPTADSGGGEQVPQPPAPKVTTGGYPVAGNANPTGGQGAPKPPNPLIKYFLFAAGIGAVAWVGLLLISLLQAFIFNSLVDSAVTGNPFARIGMSAFSEVVTGNIFSIALIFVGQAMGTSGSGSFNLPEGASAFLGNAGFAGISFGFINLLGMALLVAFLVIASRLVEKKLPAQRPLFAILAALTTAGTMILLQLFVGLIGGIEISAGPAGVSIVPFSASLIFVSLPFLFISAGFGRLAFLRTWQPKWLKDAVRYFPSVRAAAIAWSFHFVTLLVISFLVASIVLAFNAPKNLAAVIWPIPGVAALFASFGMLGLGYVDAGRGGLGLGKVISIFNFAGIGYVILAVIVTIAVVLVVSAIWARIRVPEQVSGMRDIWVLPAFYAVAALGLSILLRYSASASGLGKGGSGALSVWGVSFFTMALMGLIIDLLGRYVPILGNYVPASLANKLGRLSYSPTVAATLSQSTPVPAPVAQNAPAAPAPQAQASPVENSTRGENENSETTSAELAATTLAVSSAPEESSTPSGEENNSAETTENAEGITEEPATVEDDAAAESAKDESTAPEGQNTESSAQVPAPPAPTEKIMDLPPAPTYQMQNQAAASYGNSAYAQPPAYAQTPAASTYGQLPPASPYAASQGYGQPAGYAPAAPAAPMNPKTKKKIVLWGSIIGGLLVLILVLLGVKSYLANNVFSPRGQVENYLQAIVDGDADTAKGIIPLSPEDEASPLATTEVYKNTANRPTSFSVEDVSYDKSGNSAIVSAKLIGKGESTNLTFDVSSVGSRYVFFHDWKISAGGWNNGIAVVNESGESTKVPLLIQGANIPANLQGNRIFAYPGTYTVAPAGDNKYQQVKIMEDKVTISLNREASNSISYQVEPTEAYYSVINAALKAKVDECAKSKEKEPAGCNISFYSYSEARDIKWSVVEYPSVSSKYDLGRARYRMTAKFQAKDFLSNKYEPREYQGSGYLIYEIKNGSDGKPEVIFTRDN